MKKQTLLILILSISLVFTSSDIYDEISTEIEIIGSKYLPPTHSKMDINEPNKIDTIYFFDNYETYKFNSHGITDSKLYPNLWAIRTKNLQTQITGYSQKSFSSAFDIQYIPDSQPMSSAIITDTAHLSLPGYNGAGVTIGVLDNGIDFNHPNLVGKESGRYFVGLDGLPSCYDHGTPVAGLIAASDLDNFSGVAPGSLLYDVSFSCNQGSIEGDFLEAFDHMISLNETIRVINTSFGGFAATWDPVIKRVAQSGIIVVGSAGNTGPGLHTTTTGGPGNSLHAISVGSMNENFDISFFSSRGPAYELTSKPDFVEFGEQITSINSNGGFGSYTGTSFSSPQVAGAIAVLIEALSSQGITPNPGLIKSSLAESATGLNQAEYSQGNGIINLQAAFDLIIQNGTTNPSLVSLNPNSESPKYLQYIPRGMNVELPLTLVTSDPTNTIIELGGDFSSFQTPLIKKLYSQKLSLPIDTLLFPENSNISGSVTVRVGNYSTTQNYDLMIGNNAQAFLGIDRYHTYWDQNGGNHIGGSNIGEMIKVAMEYDIAVIEITTPLNETILADLDILWLADGLNILDSQVNSLTELGFSEGQLTELEIKLIHKFVSSGNNLFVTTLGSTFVKAGSQTVLTGLNTTLFNDLLSLYGITARSEPITENLETNSMLALNQSSIMKDVETITYAGNYLNIKTPSWTLAGLGIEQGLALYENKTSHGKVIVSSSNFWLDNLGVNGLYGSDENRVAI